MLPLYRGASAPNSYGSGNTGLWYDKFCDAWQDDWSGLGDEGKKAWVASVAERDVGERAQVKAHLERMSALLEHHSQTPLFYRLESDFVTGLGREHPVENGFAWHHTLGTPYLPGSSVKGMVRAWAEAWESARIEDVRRIFGPTADDIKKHKDVQANVGSVIFLDALPTSPVQLKADVMTPHYSDYYAGKKDKQGKLVPPADWHSPIPIPFLVVAAGQSFAFGVLPCRNDEVCRQDCETVKGWLEGALCWIGAGAKTAVGYGRFVKHGTHTPETAQRHVNTQPSVINPTQEVIDGLKGVAKTKLKSEAQGYVDKLKRLACSEEERREAARAMKEILEKANLPKLNKLNAYKELSKLAGEE